MDEMELINSRLDDIKHQIDASKEQLTSKIRYGDRSVEALVNLATDQLKGLRSRVTVLEERVEEIRKGKVADLRQELEDRASRSLTVTLAVVGWVIAIVTIILVALR